MVIVSYGNAMVDLGYRVDEGSKIYHQEIVVSTFLAPAGA